MKEILGFTAGNFDLLHPGYINAFKEAKRHCDKFIVFLQRDPSAHRKSKYKPVIPLYDRYKALMSIRYIDDVVVKGKTEPVGVHEVLDYHRDTTFPNLMDVVNHFNEGRKKYKLGEFTSSIESFNECLKANSNDELSRTYIERCKQLIREKPEKWEGIWVMKSK